MTTTRRTKGSMRSSGKAATVVGLACGLTLCLAAAVRAETARVALQFGIGYLPLSVMQAEGFWEKRAKEAGIDLTAEWQNLGNGSALNDAVLTGSADIVAGGLTPMLKLWDKTRTNLKVRGIAALDTTPILLVANRADIRTLADFKPNDKIALSVPKVSIQAVLLEMAAEKMWGEKQYDRLDSQTVSMKHPDAVVALISPQSSISAYFGSSPYQEQVLARPGIHTVVSSNDVIGGPSTFSAAWTTTGFVQKRPKVYQAFLAALDDAMALIKADKAHAVDDFIRVTGTSPAERPLLLSIVESKDNVYTTQPQATSKYADFLARIGFLSAKPSSWQDYFFENAQVRGGS